MGRRGPMWSAWTAKPAPVCIQKYKKFSLNAGGSGEVGKAGQRGAKGLGRWAKRSGRPKADGPRVVARSAEGRLSPDAQRSAEGRLSTCPRPALPALLPPHPPPVARCKVQGPSALPFPGGPTGIRTGADAKRCKGRASAPVHPRGLPGKGVHLDHKKDQKNIRFKSTAYKVGVAHSCEPTLVHSYELGLTKIRSCLTEN